MLDPSEMSLEQLQAELRHLRTRVATLEKAITPMAEGSTGTYAQILDQIHDAIIVTDARLRIRIWNRAAERLYGWPREEAVDHPIDEVVPVIRYIAGEEAGITATAILRAEGHWHGKVVQHHREGHEVFVEAHMQRVAGRVADQPVYLSSNRDIGDHWRVEEALRASDDRLHTSEARYRMLFEAIAQGVIVYDATVHAIMANPAAAHILGFSQAEIVGHSLHASDWSVCYEDGTPIPSTEHPVMAAFRSGQEVRDVVVGLTTSNYATTRWLIIQAVPQILAGQTTPAYVYVIFEDITERRRSEATFRAAAVRMTASARVAEEYAARLDSLLTYAPIGIALLDTALRYQHINAYLATMNGLPVANHLGRRISQVLPHIAPYLEPIFEQVLTTGVPLCDIEFTDEIIAVSQEPRTWNCSYFPVRDKDGILVGVGAVVSDITARRQTEQALQTSQQNLQALIENIDGIVCSVDTEYRLIVGNRRFHYDAGSFIDRQILPGEDLFSFPVSPSVQDTWRAWYDRALAGNTFSVEHPSDSVPEPRTREFHFSPIRTSEGTITGVTVFGRDITERLRAEQALRETERKLRTLFEILPVGISILDTDGAIVYANPALTQIVQMDLAGLSHGFHRRRHYLRSDGTTMPIEEFASIRALHAQEVVSDVEIGIQLESGAIRWTSVSAVPVDFPDWRVVVVTTDITARKQVEEVQHAFARRLVEAQEAERAHLARELHDEIGQMLTGLNIMLEAAQQQSADTPRTLAEAQTSVGELMELVGRMSLTLRPAMLDDLGLLPTLHWYLDRYTAQTGIQVHFQHAGLDQAFDASLTVTAYRLVQEALTNIARYAEVTEAQVTVWADPIWLNVQVEDTGRGFDVTAVLAAHRSSGLIGMRERVLLLDGEFHLDSAQGGGTRLYAALPISRSRH